MLARFFRSRLLHYLLLGAVLLAGRDLLAEPWSRLAAAWRGRPLLVVSGADRARLRSALTADRLPGREQALIDAEIDDELLYRAAVARGLDRDNAVVRDRIVQDMRLISGDTHGDDETLLREGLRLGLDRSDVVVRRQLAGTMRLLAAAPARLETASDDELRELLARQAEEFRTPAQTSLTQVFVGLQRGRGQAEAEARRLLDELRGAEPSPRSLPGDGFALGPELRDRSDAELDAVFGPGFAAAVARLPEKSWQGPIASSYGFHLVRVEARRAPALPPLDSLRRRLIERLRRERAQQRLAAWLARERARYDIRIEEPRSTKPSLEQASLPLRTLSLPRTAITGD